MRFSFGLLLVVVATALVAGVLLAPLQALPFGRDQALYATVAREMENHRALGRDIDDELSPGIFVWFFFVRKVVGELEEVFRLFEWFWLMLTCLLAGILAYEWTDKKAWAALVAAMVLAVRYLGGGYAGTLEPAGLAQLPLLIGMGFWGRPHDERGAARVAGAGLFFGIATLFCPGYATIFLPLSVLVYWEQREVQERRMAGLLKPLVFFALGLLLPIFTAAYFLPGAVFSGMTPFFVLPSLSWQQWAVDLFPPLLLFTLATIKQAPRVTLAFFGLLPLWWWLTVTSIGDPQNRILGPLAIATTLAAAEGHALLKRKGFGSAVRTAAAVAVVLATLVLSPWPTAVKQWRHFGRYLAGEYATDLATNLETEGDYHYVAVREIAGELARLGGESADLQVWGDEPGLYHYSGLHPATPFLRFPQDRRKRAHLKATIEAMVATARNREPLLVVVPPNAPANEPFDIAACKMTVERLGYRIYQCTGRPSTMEGSTPYNSVSDSATE